MRSWTRRLVVSATVAAVSFTPAVAAACALFCGPAAVHVTGPASADSANPLAAWAVDEHAAHHAAHSVPQTSARQQVSASLASLSTDDCCPVLTAVPGEPARVDRFGVDGSGTAAVDSDSVQALLTSPPVDLARRPPRCSLASAPALLPLRI